MIKEKKIFWLKANWSAPNFVRAGTSIRTGGYSRSPYNESNLSLNVGDDPKNVKKKGNFLSRLIFDEILKKIKTIVIRRPEKAKKVLNVCLSISP